MRTFSIGALIVLAMLCIGILIQYWANNAATGHYSFLKADSQVIYRLNTITGQIDIFAFSDKEWRNAVLPGSK